MNRKSSPGEYGRWSANSTLTPFWRLRRSAFIWPERILRATMWRYSSVSRKSSLNKGSERSSRGAGSSAGMWRRLLERFYETSNFKLQTSEKFQAPIPRDPAQAGLHAAVGAWNLELL